jgi:hypothetical protein
VGVASAEQVWETPEAASQALARQLAWEKLAWGKLAWERLAAEQQGWAISALQAVAPAAQPVSA